jgi:hypothetical protein
MRGKQPATSSTPEPIVKVDMDGIDSPTGPTGECRTLIQIRIHGTNEKACTKVTKAIELAVQAVCRGDDEPPHRKH